MTQDEKQKCVEVWGMLTGETTKASVWTPTAGDALAVMLAEIRECSNAMNYVPKPSGSKPGWGWIVSYVYNIFKTRYSSNKGQLFKICIAGSSQLKRDVQMKLQGL